MIYTFHPYKLVVDSKSTEWGLTEQIHLNNFDYNRTDLFEKFKNLNGFPLRISIFDRYPTAVKVHEFPKPFADSYFMRDIWRSDGYSGVDGLMLAHASKKLNFTTVNVPQIGVDFGFKSFDGTFQGKVNKSA